MASRSNVDLTLYSPEELDELLYLLDEQETLSVLNDEERQQKEERNRLQTDLGAFFRASWPILEPGVELDWSWHYELICEYLTLVYLRKIRRLIINLPPRTAKSTLVSVIFPAWVWSKQNTHNFACASYSGDLSMEHSVKRRNLIQSEWYQSRWGDSVEMAKDQNQKTKFMNTAMAQMIATSVGGTATGLGGDTLILDDGMNPKQVGSDAETLATHSWFDNTWRTRLNDLATGAFIIMEQRTGERDVTGHCLEADDLLEKEGKPREWTHLSIPLECENVPERYQFPISKRVQIREVGDVLQPKRFPPEVVASLSIRRLVYATQYQQQPSPLEGNMIKRKDIRYYGGRDPITQELDPPLPDKFDMHVVSADCTFKDLTTSDMVAVGSIAVKGPDRYVRDIVNKHLDLPSTETEILRQQKDKKASVVLVEDKANGSAVIKSIRKKVSGVVAIEPEGGKISRVFATAGEFQAGNWWFDRNAAYTETAIEQLTKFPAAKYDDIVDMITQAAIYLQRNTYVYGLTEYVKQQEAEMKRKQNRNKPANETAEEQAASIAKLDNPSTLTKPDIDDHTERCPECSGTFIQRVPGGNKRCGQCGHMMMRTGVLTSNSVSPGQLRK